MVFQGRAQRLEQGGWREAGGGNTQQLTHQLGTCAGRGTMPQGKCVYVETIR